MNFDEGKLPIESELQPGGPRLLFKGGTSLSKGFGLIARFSEDIDITVFREESENRQRLKNWSRLAARSVPRDSMPSEPPVKGLLRVRSGNRLKYCCKGRSTTQVWRLKADGSNPILMTPTNKVYCCGTPPLLLREPAISVGL
jgi:hypothetical protein